jgi:3-oxoacyl-[acyl-carrier-protein] synthase-3
MGTVIEATAFATADGRSGPPGAVELADAAARACLQRAGCATDDVQLLINAGVYLDRNISEPAIAALIQEDIGANPEIRPGGGQGTLSFDVRNGACGLLTGLHLADGLRASGTIERALVVGADADPEPGVSDGFGFPATGGAVLIGGDDSAPGLEAFRFRTFPEFAQDFQSSIDWHEHPGDGQGRNALTVEIDDRYREDALRCADTTVRELAAEQQLDLAEVDLLIATASVPGFADALARNAGLRRARVASMPDDLACSHTAAPAIALETAQLADSRTALLVSAAAGITVVAALYRR